MSTDVWGDFKREIFAEMVVGVFSWEFSCEVVKKNTRERDFLQTFYLRKK